MATQSLSGGLPVKLGRVSEFKGATLVEEWATVALARLDAENHYWLRATRGRSEVGLALVDEWLAIYSAQQSSLMFSSGRSSKPNGDRTLRSTLIAGRTIHHWMRFPRHKVKSNP